MRGKVTDAEKVTKEDRITPAYAGKRYLPVRSYHKPRDHPRLCGEKFKVRESRKSTLGSPPPMRGKATIFQSHLGNTRITPAYAGKSTETIMVCKKCWDHPRLCGEKFIKPRAN